MKVDLEVLASTNIKRKKPWPKIIWVGEEQESLLLLDPDGKRISVLYVPSGKTKRKLPKLSPLADKIVCFNHTQNGRFLLGILQNGEIFTWRKDKDVIRFIPGLDKFSQTFTPGVSRIHASDDCSHVLVTLGTHKFLLWITERGERIDLERDATLKGTWHVITVPEGMDLPSKEEAREISIAAVFYDSMVLGTCCQLSMIYNKPTMLSIATLVIKFPDPMDSFSKSLPLFSSEWSLLEYPYQQMHPEFSAVSVTGAYVSSYSGNGQVMAVAANQKSPSQAVVLFVSPLTDTVLVCGLKNCGVSDPSKFGRQYWVADMAWTSDGLFLACILKNGSVCLIPRLGEPIAIQTEGCSVNMGPSLFLPLHPAIMISNNIGNLEQSPGEQDPMQQQFSVTTHPNLPIVLFSDGFLVTVVQLPVEMTSVTLMRDFVLASAVYLKKIYKQENLDMTVADAYKLSKGQKGHKQQQQQQHKANMQRKPYEFEFAEISLNATQESETSMIETANKFGFDLFGAVGNMDSGKIVFGEAEMISIDLNATFSGLDASDALLKYLEESMTSLTSAWKLAVSFPDMWTAEVDNITKQIVHNLSKIFSIVLDCPAVDAIIPVLTPRQNSAIQNPRVYNIIVVYRNILQLLRFDTYNQHVIIATLRLVHKVITLMLSSEELEKSDPRLKTLFGCFSLLKHAESCLNRVYVWVPTPSEAGTPSQVGTPRRFEPATLVKVKKTTEADTDQHQHGVQLSYKGQLPGKRLAATWKLLYKHILEYQSAVSQAGDPHRELHQLEKLMYNVQEILQETDTEITPRSASAKLSAVWLRNAFPFGLLSESDNFLFSEHGTDPFNTPSPPCITLQHHPNSPIVHSYSSSPKDSTSSTYGSVSPSSGSRHPIFKLLGYISTQSSSSEENQRMKSNFGPILDGLHRSPSKIGSKFKSPSKDGSKFKSPSSNESKFNIFSKFRSAAALQKVKSLNKTQGENTGKSSSSSGTSFLSGNSSSLNVAEYSSSPTDLNSPHITSYSSSPKESSSPQDILTPKGSSSNTTNGTASYLSSGRDSTMPVIVMDSPKSRIQSTLDINGHVNNGDLDLPPSEGFDLEVTHEVESSRKSESVQSYMVQIENKNIIQESVLKTAKLSVDGKHTQAVEEWKEQLKILAASKKDNPKTAKMLHSVLYTYLMKDDLDQAVDFIDSLILQASIDIAMSSQELPAYDDGTQPPLMTLVTHRSKDSEEEELVPCIKNRSIRQTVQTMARFMAAYFCNETMFIFPPHSAQALPTVHLSSVPTKTRIVPKYHEDITNMVTRENLSGKWTTERTVEYLLLSGLACETAWFAYKMGDWKTAFLLAVAHTSHREIAPQLYAKAKKPLQLPEMLSPGMILQERLEVLVKFNKAQSTPAGNTKQNKRYFLPINEETNIPQLTKTLEDILTTGLVCDVEVTPWLLIRLVDKLKSVVSNLPSLVPQQFYLPAPPLYCPQPGEEEMERSHPDVQYEKELRMEISSIIQLILVVLNSAHLSLPLARWYIQELFKVQDRASQFKATTEGPCMELPEILQQYKIFRSDITDYKDSNNTAGVMSGFRDFCTILWLLHVRDELSLHLRKRGNQMSAAHSGQESPESTLGQSYIQECFVILKWAVNMLAFTNFIADDGCVHKVVLSLILELPSTEDTADILAEHFYAADMFDAEVQEKLERLLAAWKSVEIQPEDDGKSARPEENEDPRKSMDDDDDDDGSVRKSVTFYQASPRAKTLSVYYHKQCEVVQKVLKKKRKCFGQYDEYVFRQMHEEENDVGIDGSNLSKSIYIGARPFETKQSYMEFLDRFYAICFTKVVQKESNGGSKPIFALLMPFAKAVREAEFQAFLMKNEDSYQKRPSSVVMASPRARMIRSQSEPQSSEQLYDSKMSPSSAQKRSLFRSSSSGDVQPSPSQAGMSRHVSEGSLLTRNSPRGSRPPLSPMRGKANMTGMASRFFQSEDVLYRDPEHSQEAHWILDVNFGQRYLALQQLLDYLNHWANKQHLLGLHGKSEKELDIKPTMRIEVPTQLVVLGLWLLENKYSGKKGQPQGQTADIDDAPSDDTEAAVEQQILVGKAKALATVEELTERDSFTNVSNIQRSRSISPRGRRSRSHSPGGDVSRSKSAGFDMSQNKTLDSVRSITSTQEETEQIKSAYKKVLDGHRPPEGEDSSSLEVSSLEPEDYEEDLKRSLSVLGTDKSRRRRSPGRHKSPRRRQDASPDSRNNSAFNNTMPFEGSPDRAGNQRPQTSTPVRGTSRSRLRKTSEDVQEDISRISLPPGGALHRNNTAPPSHYRGGLLGGDSVQSANQRSIQGLEAGPGSQVNLGNMNIAEQLQHIVRGELRRMMEVQHQSMLAMMGALDGQSVPVAWQPEVPANQIPAQNLPPQDRRPMPGVLKELHNLQETTHKPGKKKSRSPGSTLQGKENIFDSPMRFSDLRQPQNIELYRVTQDAGNASMRMLRVPAERDQEGVRFPYIPYQAWQSQETNRGNQTVPDMPLLQLAQTPSGLMFPPQRQPPVQAPPIPGPGYFQSQTSRAQSSRLDSPDSGIGIPLLKIPTDQEVDSQHPRFGELYRPEVIMDSEQDIRQQEQLKDRYLQEFHMLQAEKAEAQERQRFGDRLLHLDLQSIAEAERDTAVGIRPKVSPRKTPRSPAKTPRSVSEQVSFKKEKISARSKSPVSEKSKSQKSSVRSKSQKSARLASERGGVEGEESEDEEEESEDEDATEAESVPEEEEAEEVLHDGYVFQQGEFEAYLALEKALTKTKDTNARIQLKTALRLQKQRMMENWKRPKVDFSTNTHEQFDAGTEPDIEIENRRTSEKATSITKDTGVDPIHEAVIEYNKSRQPAVLPPDIYMGLRFTDAGQQPVSGDIQESRGRAYLNVVDLDASAVLRDLGGDRPDHEQPVMDQPVLPTQQFIRHQIAEEEKKERAVHQRPRGADELTVKMFETKVQGEDRLSMAILPRESMPDSKFAIMQRLRDMNSQLAAIDRMSNNIEREFKSTRLAIKTLDHLTDAMEVAPTAHDIEDAGRQVDFQEAEVSRGPSPDGRKSRTPKHSSRSPDVSARHTARSQRSRASVEDKKQMSSELAKMSGLSGISDIIGDMVAQGDIDLEDVGLTRSEADQLVQRGAIRHEEVEEARMSLDDIKHMSKQIKEQGHDKEAIRHWMASKRRERMLEYRRHLDLLREKETKPFKSKQDHFDQSIYMNDMKTRENARKDSRRTDMTKRLDEAESLLGNLLTEKVELPRDPPQRATPKRKPGKDRSPVSGRERTVAKTKTLYKESPVPKKPAGILKTRDSSPPYQYNINKEHAIDDYEDDYYMEDIQMRDAYYQPEPIRQQQQQGARQIVVQPREERQEPVSVRPPGKRPSDVVPRLKLSLDDVEEEPNMQRTTETTGELSAYYRAVEAMDVTGSHDQLADRDPEPAQDTPKKQYKSKPFTEIVKMQRPHVTRKQPNKVGTNYVGRLQSVSQSETSRTSARTELTQREKEMIHGSKRLPGSSRQRTGPVRVKTYTERLQEMKGQEKYSTPVAPRSQYGSTIASQSARTGPVTRVIKPKHKPMTYVEQLQKLNEGTHKPRVGGATTVIQRPVVRSHKPLHKPKTYAEQLQALQPQKPAQGPPSRRIPRPTATRQRPYKDPYAPMPGDSLDRLDSESVVSAWSMGDDVRHLLYDDAASSIAVGQSASYAPSEQQSDYYDAVMGGDDYTASVDIDDLVQIADAGSISSGSMMSFIDWDQVDDLIADVG